MYSKEINSISNFQLKIQALQIPFKNKKQKLS